MQGVPVFELGSSGPIISGPLSGGKTMTIGVRHAASAGKGYALAFSFGAAPGIPIPGVGTIPLNADGLFFLSLLAGPPIFNNMQGTLDSNGDALASLVPPAALPPSLTVYTAFVTYDTAIRTISNPVKVVSQ